METRIAGHQFLKDQLPEQSQVLQDVIQKFKGRTLEQVRTRDDPEFRSRSIEKGLTPQ
jgi:hypothetical protein